MILPIVAALAQSVPGPPPVGVAPPPPPPPPKLRVVRMPDPKRYYPARERKAKREGTADVGLVLRNDGRIARCRITASSGAAALDAAACRLARAIRFERSTLAGRSPSSEYGCCLDYEVKWALAGSTLRRIYYPHPPLLQNYRELVGSADYPASALRAGEEGLTGVDLDVDAEGRVTACTVGLSSGSAALDSTTCRLASARARFLPGRSRYGDPAGGTVRVRIRWQLGS